MNKKIIAPKQNTPCEGCFIQKIASNTIQCVINNQHKYQGFKY